MLNLQSLTWQSKEVMQLGTVDSKIFRISSAEPIKQQQLSSLLSIRLTNSKHIFDRTEQYESHKKLIYE
jgi:hypothetical protein